MRFHLRDESVKNVVTRRAVVLTTLVIGEVVLHGADGKLLLEPIDLVQEQDDGCLDEPPRVADGVEQCEGFLHTVDSLVLKKKLIVLGNGDEKQNRRDVLKTVNPLLSLGSLSTNVEHTVGKFADDECGLRNTSSFDTRSEDILVVGHVVVCRDSGDVVEIATTMLDSGLMFR